MVTETYPHSSAARLRKQILCLWQHRLLSYLHPIEQDRGKASSGRNYNLSTQIDRHGIPNDTLPPREYHEPVHDLDRRRIITDRGHDTADFTETT